MTLDERITRYLDKCPPAVEGNGGDNQTFTVACALVNGFALDEAEALRHMLVYNATCSPPWKERDLRRKVQEAAKISHAKPRGHLLGTGKNLPRDASNASAKPVSVRLTAKSRQSRTVRTVLSKTLTYARKKEECFPSHIASSASGASGASEPENAAKVPSPTQSEPSETSELARPGETLVSGCHMPRPDEIVCSDGTWRTLNAHPLGSEPLIHVALALFGPDATILSTKEAA